MKVMIIWQFKKDQHRVIITSGDPPPPRTFCTCCCWWVSSRYLWLERSISWSSRVYLSYCLFCPVKRAYKIELGTVLVHWFCLLLSCKCNGCFLLLWTWCYNKIKTMGEEDIPIDHKFAGFIKTLSISIKTEWLLGNKGCLLKL